MKEEELATDKEWVRGHEPKFLFIDCETSPVTGTAWGIYEQDLLWHEMGEILMMGYMWGGEKRAHILSQRQYDGWTKNRSRERRLMEDIFNVLDEADVVIGYNAKKFDIKQINARFAKYGMIEPSGYHALDPLQMIKRSMTFPSHKLEDMAEYLKIGHKVQTGGKYLWKRCMEGDMDAWAHMEMYCKNDVVLVKDVYERLKGWDKSVFNYNFYTRVALACKKCGSKDMKSRGRKFFRSGFRRDWLCTRCGHRFNGILEKDNIEKVETY